MADLTDPVPDQTGAILTVHLDAIVENWRTQAAQAQPALCAAVVKADAYGLGMHKVAPALNRAGCAAFFVATLDEGLALRALVPEAVIHVLNGPFPGTTRLFLDSSLVPVLNTPEQVTQWTHEAEGAVAALHVDTGMSRLGLTESEVRLLAEDKQTRARLNLRLLISHLACSEEPDNPMNARQLSIFNTMREMLGNPPGSFANSSGIWLGTDYVFSMVRPGAALYGINPTPGRDNPMRNAATLMGRVIQVRDSRPGDTVGYGATHTLTDGGRVATVAVGYADGYLRALSNKAKGHIAGVDVPLVGRVSMDLLTFDVTAVAEVDIHPNAWIELMGPHVPVDFLADRAGTIGYEILTALGTRYFRRHTESE